MGRNIIIAGIVLVAVFLELSLYNMWQADQNYAMGKSLNSSQQFVAARDYLAKAVEANPDEPTFRDELAYNQAVLATALLQNNSTESAKLFAAQAIANSDLVVNTSPNSLPFWKNRVKIFYQLALYPQALDALTKAQRLAPTDPKIAYNLGLVLIRLGQKDAGIKELKHALDLKPDYYEVQNVLDKIASAK